MKVGLSLITCGTCGRSRGIRHTCVTRADSRRRKTRTTVRPRLTVACGKCGKPRGLRHTCTIKTDFKKRLRKAARRESARERKQRAAAAKARRTAAAGQRKTDAKASRKRPRATPHDPANCRVPDCERYGCVKYREGFDDGLENCPRPHGVA